MKSVPSCFRNSRTRNAVILGAMAAFLAICAPKVMAAARGFYARLTILSTIVRLARDVYVDEVDTDRLMDGAIDGLLDRLDPHSDYLPPEEAARFGERIRGSFGGVGIYYTIIEGLPTVTSVIEGGPAEHAGLLSGDRILSVDGLTTVNWREAEVQEHLKGPVGTRVRLEIRRNGRETPLPVEIVRGVIPLKSVPYAFMLDDTTGYIRIANFAQTTGQEVEEAIGRLNDAGMRCLVLDLRDNGGGELNAAVAVADFFLEAGSVIVSQRGRWEQANQTYFATSGSRKVDTPVVVLINRGSASASEIVAGALQDTDRGIIVGQQSFGKGLVQRQFDLSQQAQGGGVLLLTVARYYTPTGRLIQRDYGAGTAQYIFSGIAEGVRVDTSQGLRFVTPLGRVVYGKGGISPDYAIPRNDPDPVLAKLYSSALFFRFVNDAANTVVATPQGGEEFRASQLVDDRVLATFFDFCERMDSSFTKSKLEAKENSIRPHLAAAIAEKTWGQQGRYRVLAPFDTELSAARAHLVDARSLLNRSRSGRAHIGR